MSGAAFKVKRLGKELIKVNPAAFLCIPQEFTHLAEGPHLLCTLNFIPIPEELTILPT